MQRLLNPEEIALRRDWVMKLNRRNLLYIKAHMLLCGARGVMCVHLLICVHTKP
jgi:hypothetical protein